MSNTILIKRSSTPNAAPTTGQLSLGELAINTNDGRLYTKIDTGTPAIFELTQNQPISLLGNVTGTSTNYANGTTQITATLSTTGVIANTYGGTTGATSNIGVFTVDQYGRITSASNVAISTSSLANGTANIQVYNNGNIAISPGGAANVAVYSTTGETVTGIISATGNVVAGGNVVSQGYITAVGNIQGVNLYATGNVNAATGITTQDGISAQGNIIGGNINTGGVVSASGNIISGNTVKSANLSLSGNIISAVNTTFNITTTGNVAGGNVLTDNLLYANGTPWDLQQAAGANNEIQYNENDDFAASANFTFNPLTNTLTVTGDANVTNLNASTAVSASGNVTGGNVNATGIVSSTGNVVAGDTLKGANLSLSGNLISALNTTSTISTTGNVKAGNVLTDNLLYANGTPWDLQQAAGANNQIQFNENNNFSASSNFTFDPLTSTLTVTGDANVTNLHASTAVSAVGNVTGGNLITSGLITALANITGANINTGGVVSATGNVKGGNVVSVAAFGWTGTGANATITNDGSIRLNPDTAASATNGVLIGGSGFILGPDGSRNMTLNYNSESGLAGAYRLGIYGNQSGAILNYGSNTIGSIGNATTYFGNAYVNNVWTTIVTASGNVVGGNINTSNQISAGGNVTGGNINTANQVSAGAIVPPAIFNTPGSDSAGGNVTGGNITTAGSVVTPTLTSTAGLTISTGSNGNIYLAPNGTGNINAGLTYINSLKDPVLDQDAATKNYVDTMVSTGIDIHTAVKTDADNNLSATYVDGGTTPTWTSITTNDTLNTGSAHGLAVNDVIVFGTTTNGITANVPYFVHSAPSSTSITIADNYNGEPITTLTNGSISLTSEANTGVGATLTSTTNGPLTLEEYTAVLNDRVLILGQTNAYENGVYYVSQAGVADPGGSPWILTRATDANKYGERNSTTLSEGAYFLVTAGNDAGESYVCNTTGTIVFGTTNITFAEFSQVTPIQAGNGLSYTNGGTTLNVNVDEITTTISGDAVVVKASAQFTTPNIGAATGTSLSVTGNVTGGNINTGGVVSATGNIIGGNVNTTIVSASGNITGANVNTGIVSASGNVIGGNVTTAGLITATGNITGGNITTTGLASIATLTVTTGANVTAATASTNTTSGALVITGGLGVGGNVYAGALYDNGVAVLTINSTVDGGTY